MTISDVQARNLMVELRNGASIGVAAQRAGMDRKTARKYRDLGQLPSDLKAPRMWRTRQNPFAEDWPEIVAMLEESPELRAKTIFEELQRRSGGRYQEGQLRTLQRHIRRWRAESGPGKEVFFAQQHRPGEAAQTDFTRASELGVTINGEPFDHWLCHFVLPYSNWQWATVCLSESFASLKRGIQSTLFALGAVPEYHQTDNSTAATHVRRAPKGRRSRQERPGSKALRDGQAVGATPESERSSGRAFNAEYLRVMDHFGMKPRTTAIGAKEQNGSVESLNGALKRRLKQALLLRQSHDFDSQQSYERWVWSVIREVNRTRKAKLEVECSAMKPLRVERLLEFVVKQVRVTRGSTIRVLGNTYSVPSRLIRETVTVKIFAERLEVWFGGRKVLEVERLLGSKKSRVNYRHVVHSLVRKPGAFARYRFREAFFPSVVFRRAYDRLQEALGEWHGDLEYLRVLQQAARTWEEDVEVALELLLEAGRLPTHEEVLGLLCLDKPKIPETPPFEVDLSTYDSLLVKPEALGEAG